MPERIQMRRYRGWRMPAGVINVARPTIWGNPYKVGTAGVPDPATAVALYRTALDAALSDTAGPSEPRVMRIRFASPDDARQQLAALQGKTLGCFCRPEQPCHADVLLAAANPEGDQR